MAALGVPLADLQKGNTGKTLLKVAEGLKAIQNPAERAADAQQLFGRAGVQMLPVLLKGRAGSRSCSPSRRSRATTSTRRA